MEKVCEGFLFFCEVLDGRLGEKVAPYKKVDEDSG